MTDTPSMTFCNLIEAARIQASVHKNLARVTRCFLPPRHIWLMRLSTIIDQLV